MPKSCCLPWFPATKFSIFDMKTTWYSCTVQVSHLDVHRLANLPPPPRSQQQSQLLDLLLRRSQVVNLWTHPSFLICCFLWTKYDVDSHFKLILNPLGFAFNFGERWAHVAQVGSPLSSLRPGVVWLRISLADICHDRQWCTFFKPYFYAKRIQS